MVLEGKRGYINMHSDEIAWIIENELSHDTDKVLMIQRSEYGALRFNIHVIEGDKELDEIDRQRSLKNIRELGEKIWDSSKCMFCGGIGHGKDGAECPHSKVIS